MKILVIQTAFLGDFVLTLPLIRRLHDENPDAAITVAVRSSLAEFAADQPGVAAVLPIRKRRGWLERLGNDSETLQALSASKFDAVYVAHKSFRSGLHARWTGAPHRVGFRGSPASWGCTTLVPYDQSRYVLERYLSLAGQLGSWNGILAPEVRVTDEARRQRDALLSELDIAGDKPLALLAPGSVWRTKRWTPEGFAEVAVWLRGKGYAVVVDGSPDESQLCDDVCERAGGAAVSTAGDTSLPVLAALLERSELLIGNDSGPAHLASALHTASVLIFGPTSSRSDVAPGGSPVEREDLDCRPCGRHGAKRCPLGHHACMRDLHASEVIAMIERRLERLRVRKLLARRA